MNSQQKRTTTPANSVPTNTFTLGPVAVHYARILELIIVMVATVVTFVAVDGSGINAVVASAFVGLASTLLPSNTLLPSRQIQACVYIGTFAGMCSPAMVIVPAEVVILGFVAGVITVASRPLFVGIGGKMGTIAFLASLTVFWGEGPLWWNSLQAKSFIYSIGQTPFLAHLSYCFVALIGTFTTYELSQKYAGKQVVASAGSTLVFCAGLFLLTTLGVSKVNFAVLAALFFAGSFIGMSNNKRIHRGHLFAATALMAISWPFLNTTIGLMGGALGFSAFLSLVGVWVLGFTTLKVMRRL